MNETWLGTIPAIGSAFIVISAWLYMAGGRDGKWKRRFLGSLISATAIWVELLLLSAFQMIQLVLYPALIGQFSLGYGSEILPIKVLRRSIVVVASLGVGCILAWTIGGAAWVILPVHAAVAATSVWLAIKNPLPAASEEFFVCLLLTECNLLYPFAGRAF